MPVNEHDEESRTLHIPLAEEELEAHVYQRQEGVVRFSKRVETDPVETQVEVRSDDVFVERLPRDEIVTTPRSPWYEGDTMIIPVYEERLVMEKRLVLTEEIHVRRTVKTEQVDIQDTVRREVVDIETERTPDVS